MVYQWFIKYHHGYQQNFLLLFLSAKMNVTETYNTRNAGMKKENTYEK